jgi:hypothetical protein
VEVCGVGVVRSGAGVCGVCLLQVLRAVVGVFDGLDGLEVEVDLR